jgi:putative ABC transport system permease protein
VARVAGVRTATGVVSAPGVRVLGQNGKILDAASSTVLGTNWRDGDSFVQLRAGHGPAADDEVAVNATLAEAAGLSTGRTVTLLTADLTRRTFRVVGVYGYAGGRDSAAGACELAFRLPVAAQLLLGEADRYTALHVTAAPGVPASRLRDDLARLAGPGFQASTGRGYVAALISRDRARGQDFFQRVLLGFSGIAAGVGALLIINTFLILVTQRTRELALLRALGASRGHACGITNMPGW